MFESKCNPKIRNQILPTVHKAHHIELQKYQMHSVKAAYAITEVWDRVIDSKMESAFCKEIVTSLMDCLAFFSLVLSELNNFRRDYLKSRLPEKMNSLKKMSQQNQNGSSEMI